MPEAFTYCWTDHKTGKLFAYKEEQKRRAILGWQKRKGLI